jgi:hypothetical protein
MIKGKETKLGKEMRVAGFPYCFSNKGWLKHCPACIRVYKFKKKLK